ncbi:AraC family transcriptional regulator [Amphibacillus sp. MSJ-3]|uniref:AraC family transcriptional regulator n=1 Tax=Amphibacillus sp. MSJ-3 TaxID=2841505 RepID=UPI001C0F2B88|nr:AraC family transcriptional regulator [Amphibacillus sp. MSJ-3]MBU5594571.1 AraC family transcriptional regulator [Amphibacillus sp. MSJ-3]
MIETFPYVGADYYSDHFRANQLKIVKEQLNTKEQLVHRDEIEFIYIDNGKGRININGTLFPVQAGDLLLLMPYHVRGLIAKKDSTIDLYRITFSIGLLLLTNTNRELYLAKVKEMDQVSPIKSLSTRERSQVTFICEEVFQEKKLNQHLTESLNLALVSLLSYTYHKNIPQKNAAIIKGNDQWRILQYIQVHHQSKLTLSTVSNALNIPEEEIKQVLKQLTGVGFNENLNRVRIRNATALLQFEELSINQISRICGYQTEANFYKQFKKIRGVISLNFRNQEPTVYKKKNRADAWSIYIYIQENYKKPITLSIAAESLSLTEKKITRLLHKTFEKSFNELLNETRLLIARNLLLTLNKSVAEIVRLVGFNNSATFTRQFKAMYDYTPKQFVKVYRQRQS